MTIRLEGAAAELTRSLAAAHELKVGGDIDGRQCDPVTYLLAKLQEQFAPFAEETRMTAMLEFMGFQRRHGENINAVLAGHC